MSDLCCPAHPWGRVRPYRTTGPRGPGIYSQCVPSNGDAPHLLEIQDPRLGRFHRSDAPLRGEVRLVEGAESVLTPSELDVLCAAANGLTSGETAHSLMKGEATVKTQRRQVLAKMGARNIAHAVCIATEDGLVRCTDPRDEESETLELVAAAVA
ncbi:MAG: helix-turn-helix transcriptional regulator [Gaiellales bacterium]